MIKYFFVFIICISSFTIVAQINNIEFQQKNDKRINFSGNIKIENEQKIFERCKAFIQTDSTISIQSLYCNDVEKNNIFAHCTIYPSRKDINAYFFGELRKMNITFNIVINIKNNLLIYEYKDFYVKYTDFENIPYNNFLFERRRFTKKLNTFTNDKIELLVANLKTSVLSKY